VISNQGYVSIHTVGDVSSIAISMDKPDGKGRSSSIHAMYFRLGDIRIDPAIEFRDCGDGRRASKVPVSVNADDGSIVQVDRLQLFNSDEDWAKD
jgi:hypothetical protein